MNAPKFDRLPGILNVSRFHRDLDHYSLSLAAGDFATERITGNGQSFVELSIDPMGYNVESILTYRQPVRGPLGMAAIFALSQRSRHDNVSLEVVDGVDDGEAPQPIAIASISQSTTTLTIVLQQPFDGLKGEWITIYGIADTRYCYENATVASVSTDRKTLTVTVADESTITSLTLGAITNTGYVLRKRRYIPTLNGAAIRFSGGTATSAALLTRSSGAIVRKSGTFGGADTVTIGTSAPVYTGATTGQVEIKATNCYAMEVERGGVTWSDWTLDQTSSASTMRGLMEGSGIPDQSKLYNVRLRASEPLNKSRPVAKIVSAVKTGTTTATITTDVPHGLGVGALIGIRGVRDQTNFAATTGAVVVSVPSSTSLTVAFGATATATSTGGAITIEYGSQPMQGSITQAVQSAAITEGRLTLIGSTNWSGVQEGEYCNLIGCRKSTDNSDMGLDGAYRVVTVTTTYLVLARITDLDGNDVLNGAGQAVSPVLNDLTTTNCGGAICMRTTARLHDLQIRQYNYDIVKLYGQGEDRADMALPVLIKNAATYTSPYTSNAAANALTTAATTNATSVKTTAGNIFELGVTNIGASPIYLKLYNKASAPTVGTDIPILTIPIPANGFLSYEFGSVGKRFTTGIAYAITGAVGDTDTTAIAAGSKLSLTYI